MIRSPASVLLRRTVASFSTKSISLQSQIPNSRRAHGSVKRQRHRKPCSLPLRRSFAILSNLTCSSCVKARRQSLRTVSAHIFRKDTPQVGAFERSANNGELTTDRAVGYARLRSLTCASIHHFRGNLSEPNVPTAPSRLWGPRLGHFGQNQSQSLSCLAVSLHA
jgi:hypothetical protein